MRILAVSARSAEGSDLDAVAAAASQAGHEARVVRPGASGGRAREAALAAKVAKQALLWRPQVAVLEASPYVWAAAAPLRAARIPYLVWTPGPEAFEAAGERGPLFENTQGGACRAAAALLVGSDLAAEALARGTGVEDMELLQQGVDLELLPLGDRAEAKAALRLPPDRRVIGLVGDLHPYTQLDLLSLAHRKIPGLSLLVAGEGPLAGAIFAMSASTRPSSPVVHVGPLSPATRVLTACASDVGLALDSRGLSPESWNFAALGRRQVTYEVPGTDTLAATYPDHRTVFAAPAHPESLREVLVHALQEELEVGPLPEAAVQTARRQLDASTRWTRLIERTVQCA